jgi:hypothetical protein
MDANPSTAHMFIVNPLSGKSLQSLFSTHPPVEERISRLRGARPVQRLVGATATATGRESAGNGRQGFLG